VVEDAVLAEELPLRVRRLREGVELEGDLARADVGIDLASLLRLLHGVLEVGHPRAQHLLDAVAHRARAVVELEGRLGEEAAARKHLPLGVVDHVVAERPHACQAAGSFAGRRDDLAHEHLRCMVDRRELELLLRAEVREEPALAHSRRLRQAADRERLEPLLGRERCRGVEDGVACALSLCEHDRSIIGHCLADPRRNT
jgi:hypothetical protein